MIFVVYLIKHLEIHHQLSLAVVAGMEKMNDHARTD